MGKPRIVILGAGLGGTIAAFEVKDAVGDRADVSDIAGSYWSDELQASVQIGGGDGAAHAGFQGMLGQGPVENEPHAAVIPAPHHAQDAVI
jgi:hypothetical protein